MTKEEWRKELTDYIDIDDKVFIEKYLCDKLGGDEQLDEHLKALDEFKEKYSKQSKAHRSCPIVLRL